LQHTYETYETLATCASSYRSVFDRLREMMSQPAMTFSWWRRGGGGAVHAVPATSEREVGHCATDMAATVSRSGAAQQGMATAAWQTGQRGEMAAAAMQQNT
jgi:hypothetical protein